LAIDMRALDVRTGASVASFRQCAAPPRCATGIQCVSDVETSGFTLGVPQCNGKGGKSAVHFYKWGKEQVSLACSLAEVLRSFAMTPDGVFALGGSESGVLYVWDVASGELLRSHKAHYRSLCALTLSSDGGFVITGGDDALVHVWNIATLVDQGNQGAAVKPEATFTDHSLPVTSIACGSGGVGGYVFTGSLDLTCKIYDLARFSLVASVKCASPVTCLAVDALEMFLFRGCRDGKIYATALNASADAHEAASVFEGHSGPVTCLQCTNTGTKLVSSSTDGTVCVWDVLTGQLLRKMTPHDGLAVASIKLVSRPLSAFRGDGGAGMLIKPLQRYKRDQASAAPAVLARLCGSGEPEGESFEASSSRFAGMPSAPTPVSNGGAAAQEVKRLEAKVAELEARELKWKSVNERLYQMVQQKGRQ